MPPDFAAWYAALGLAPGASDEEIARAKRAYNELYHADRLAHMSATARAIAEEKVKAANEAARALLDPALRDRRDAWVADGGRPAESGQGPAPPDRGSPARAAGTPAPAARPAPARRAHRLPRRFRGCLVLVLAAAVGAMLATYAFDAEPGGAGQASVPVVPESLPARNRAAPPPAPRRDPVPAAPRPSIPGPSLRPVIDSIIRVQGDGRWSAPVTTGGAAFRAAVFPEGPRANYRLRVDGREVQVLLDRPAIRWDRPEGTWEFATLTGTAARLRFSRWPASAPAGTVVHSNLVVAGADGEWSGRVWLGGLRLTWEPDRSVTYEARDDRGRTYRLPPNLRSIVADPLPEWLQFRAVDGLPLTLAVRYAVP
ncbi:MAG TPA: hypothetical protein VF862_04730 [Gemmatimonadales bacterium]